MKTLLKVLAIGVAVIVLAVVAFIGVRAYNTERYSMDAETTERAGMNTDLSSYPTSIDGATVSEISGDYLAGLHLSPAERTHPGVVVIFGGSEGSSDFNRAAALASQGYEVLSLTFFGQPNQQEVLAEVPLEFFDEVLTYTASRIEQPRPLTVIGTSKGAELALNLAARYDEISHVIAIAPAEYTYQGLSFGQEAFSSFTYQGEPVPYLDFMSSGVDVVVPMMLRLALALPVSYRPSYEAAVDSASPEKRQAARISLDEFTGTGLLIAGDSDAMWQSEVAAAAIAERYPAFEAVIYPGAGHIFVPDFPGSDTISGGTEEANLAARDASQALISERLAQWHGE